MEIPKSKILLFCILFVIIMTTFTMISGYITVRTWMFQFFLSGVIVFLFPGIFFEKSIFYLLLYFTVLLVNWQSGDGFFNITRVLVEFTQYFIYASIFIILTQQEEFKMLYVIVKVCLIIAAVTAVLTITFAITNPDVVRSLVAMSNDPNQSETLRSFYRIGITNYALPHALPFIFSPIIFLLKNVPVRKKVILFFFFILLILLVYFSGATTPIILSILVITTSMIVSQEISIEENIFRICCLFIVFSILCNDFVVSNIIQLIDPIVQGTPIQQKVPEIEKFLMDGESTGDLDARITLYNKTWDAFLNNILIGTDDATQIGGHCYFADRLGMLGLIGGVPLILFFYSQFRYSYTFISKERRIYFFIGLICFIILGFIKNMSGIEYWLYSLVLLPTFCINKNQEDS